MTAVEDWGWVNWYATRRHLVAPGVFAGGHRLSLCRRVNVVRISGHPGNADIPKCNFCQRKVSA